MKHLIFPEKFILNLATLGKLGHMGKMPGTNGTFAGLIFYTIFFHALSPFGFLLFGGLTVYLSIFVCTHAERILNKKDPSCIILDEFVATPFCFAGLNYYMELYPMWWTMIAGFLLFRFFDIVKPFGIKKLQDLKDGLGVMADDLVAALLTCICLHLWIKFQLFPYV